MGLGGVRRAQPSHSPRAFPRDVEPQRRRRTWLVLGASAHKEAAAKGRPSRVEQRQEREEGGAARSARRTSMTSCDVSTPPAVLETR